MLVSSISLRNFRNYDDINIDFRPSVNVLVGGNAQGKTNILEAVFYAATGKSHRTVHDMELIKWGNREFKLTLNGKHNSGSFRIDITVRSDGKKILKVNGQLRKKLSELLGTLNVVMFSPEDMMLVKGGPSIRRKFLDIEISQVSPYYCHALYNYNKVLLHRNNLLKAIRESRAEKEMLDIWDQQLVEYGTSIIKKRAETMSKIIPLAREIHRQITDGKEELNLSYQPFLEIIESKKESAEELFLSKLREMRHLEIGKGVTMLGPHRDDIGIRIGDTVVKSFGSQGQQRTCALSIKLSELELMKMETGEYPVLLLDDVMSELDISRRKYLLTVVNGKVQTFVTATGAGELYEPAGSSVKIMEVQSGQIKVVQEG